MTEINTKKTPALTIIISLVALVIGFGGGVFYQKSKTPTFKNGQFQGQKFPGNQPNGNANRNGFRPVTGEIISVDNNSMTIKTQDGGNKIVVFSNTTQINKSDAGSTADLKTGETVMVSGQTNSDGSVTAQMVQLNPQNGGQQEPQNTTPSPVK